MFHLSVLGVILLSPGLKTVEIISIYLILLRFDSKYDRIFKKPENALLVKKFLSLILYFFSFQIVTR
jgi:hypothetical protein